MTKKALTLALKALQAVQPECDDFHHNKKEMHDWSETCKPLERYNQAITAIKEALSELEQDDEVLGFNGWGFPIEKPNKVMTTQTEALTLLVHEMEYVLSCINENKIPFDGDDFHEALRLGKEALENHIPDVKKMVAQPEQEKERCVGCEACIDTACGRDECPKGWPKAAQPEQEPVAVVTGVYGGRFTYAPFKSTVVLPVGMALYLQPPQRTWVELTAGEISKIWGELPQTSNEEKDAIEFGFAIETALRKRNA